MIVGISLKGELKTSQKQIRMALGSCVGGVWSQAVLPSPGNCPWSSESRGCAPQPGAPASTPHLLKHQLRLLLTPFRPLQATALLPQRLHCVCELASRVPALPVTSGLLISPRAALPSELESQGAPAWHGSCPGCLSGFLLQLCCGRSCPAPPGSGREQESAGEEQLQLRR